MSLSSCGIGTAGSGEAAAAIVACLRLCACASQRRGYCTALACARMPPGGARKAAPAAATSRARARSQVGPACERQRRRPKSARPSAALSVHNSRVAPRDVTRAMAAGGLEAAPAEAVPSQQPLPPQPQLLLLDLLRHWLIWLLASLRCVLPGATQRAAQSAKSRRATPRGFCAFPSRRARSLLQRR